MWNDSTYSIEYFDKKKLFFDRTEEQLLYMEENTFEGQNNIVSYNCDISAYLCIVLN